LLRTIETVETVVQAHSNLSNLSFKQICNNLGLIIEVIVCGNLESNDESQILLSYFAVSYLLQTQSYIYMKAKNEHDGGFLIVRYFNHERQCHLLRPNPLHAPQVDVARYNNPRYYTVSACAAGKAESCFSINQSGSNLKSV